MEEAFLARIQLMEKHLDEIVTKASKILEATEIEGVSVDEVIKLKLKLKQAIDRYSTSINHYMEKTEIPSCDIVSASTIRQLEADDVLANIEAVLAIHTAAKAQNTTQNHHTKLPTLPPPKFSGDILQFHQFWDKFQATIDKRNLEDVDKLAYLVASLEGKALEAVNGLDISNKNYAIAIEALQHQFGNKDILIDAHHEALKQLPAAQSLDGCRHTLNTIEHHLRVLQTLGEDVDGNHLRTTIKNKFPDQTLYELNMALPAEQNTVPNIRKTLDKIITASERAGPSLSKCLKTTEAVSSAQALLQAEGGRSFKTAKNKFMSSRGTATRKVQQHEKISPVPQKRKQTNVPTTTAYNRTKRPKKACIFCDGPHYSSECQETKTLADRKLKLGNRCHKCFRTGHFIRDCDLKKSCYNCKGNHHQALCPKKNGMEINNTNEVSQTICNIHNIMSILQTATVNLANGNEERTCRLLLDSGSQRSYITANMAKHLKLVADKEDLLIIYTFGSDTPKETSSPSVEVDIKTKRGVTRRIRVNIVPHITDRVPVQQFELNSEIDIMADDRSVGEGIDMLIGNDYYTSFMKNKNIKIQDYLFLIDTDFGWILTGSMDDPDERKEALSVITYCQCHDSERLYFSEPDLPLRETDIKFLWALESIGITDSAKTTREEEAVKHFTETVKYENGRYHVKWPWTEFPPDLATNFGLAYGRLKSLVRRLDQKTLYEYETILQEQLDNKIIEVIDPQPISVNQTTPPVHYLPHHIIKHEDKKGRIVYDASAKVKEQRSLNESMYRGPSMLEDLTALLVKFRSNKIGITADVEKAFLQVGLQEADRDVTRFLWLKDIQKEVTEDNLLHLRFCRVPFGIISSPFLLTATIRHHLSKTRNELLSKIADKCYVDNLVTTASNTESAYNLYLETRNAFQELSMNIREWASNDLNFINKIPKENRAKNMETVKVLGLTWNINDDSLQLKLNKKVFNEENIENTKNKRDVLRMLASFYDPCGFLSPLVLPAKILMQQLWRLKLSWDTPLPEQLITTWEKIVTTLQIARDIRLPRYIGNEDPSDRNTEHELHCFADASNHAHAAVVYLRVTNKRGSKTAFIMSKSRVNPINEKEDLQIPRLELLGYVIGSRLLSYVKNVLEIPITKQFLWTDSLVVLSWVRSNKLLPPFVARRVNEIKQNPELTMRYINTEQNPADLATRPDVWLQKRKLWFQGPLFLSKKDVPWPDDPRLENHRSLLSAAEEGLDTEYPEKATNENTENSDVIMLEQMETDNEDITVMVEETNPQLQEIINLQKEYYKEEFMGKETHLSRNLGLFLDVDGLLRCKGRMVHTDWSYERKHPILLPKDCEYTSKVIMETHEKNYHVGVPHTLSIIREKFWIPQGRSQVQRILKKCPQCVKHGGGPYKLPSTPALPPERVTYNHPFTYTGLDYFGPMYVTTQQGKTKRWICLFTCLVVRAIHLEVVNDLTAQECLLALRRFVASRGTPTLIVSDNALQFKLTSEVFTHTYCSQYNIKWKFIPQLAPWHGGVYERMVAVVKHCLTRTLEKHLLTDNQLTTVIKEVENVCNTRPLTYVGTELGHILKPADFLSVGKCIVMDHMDDETLTAAGTSARQNLVEGWKRGQIILSEFKTMFVGQYLSSLRERYNQSHKQPRVKSNRIPRVGDVVQLKDSMKNREIWKVGMISSLIKSPDGECRVARVKVGNTEFTRSIGHLYPLESDITDECNHQEFQIEEPGRNNCGRLQMQDQEMFDRSQNLEDEVASSVEKLPNTRNDEKRPDTSPLVEENEGRLSEQQSEAVESARDSNFEEEVVVPQVLDPEAVDSTRGSMEAHDETEVRSRREAAIRAREKIAEWTRLLFVLLK